jgi:hypothetical protein
MSIWFAESYIGAVLCKDSRQVGLQIEEFVDGGFSWWRGCVISYRGVHSISYNLHLYCCDA